MKHLMILAAMVTLAVPAIADTFGTGANQFTIDFVTISGATNPTSGYGIVNNDYRMGKFEITNDQWNKFKAVYGSVVGSPSSAYNSSPYWTGVDVPTNNVSWYEAAQFVNYLNTSKGYQAAYKFTGTQGTSDYTFGIWDATDAWGGTNLYRHKGAYYFLPTEDEWVKAAYWNGSNIQTYATKAGESLAQGNGTSGTGWNYNYPPNIDQPWNVGSGSQELNGTYDMMGNVYEHMESPWNRGEYVTGFRRGLRGGACDDPGNILMSSYHLFSDPGSDATTTGFRIASIPEPCTLLLLGVGGLLIRKR